MKATYVPGEAADAASQLLADVQAMVREGVATEVIVDHMSQHLRDLTEKTMSSSARANYERRRLEGEPILSILRDLSRGA